MFVTIRRYSPKNGAINKASLDLLRRQLHDEFLPLLRAIPGFSGYYVVSVDNRELVTLSFCNSAEGSVESSRCSAEYTFRNPLVFELGRPEVIEQWRRRRRSCDRLVVRRIPRYASDSIGAVNAFDSRPIQGGWHWRRPPVSSPTRTAG
jgi:hypothetical protein